MNQLVVFCGIFLLPVAIASAENLDWKAIVAAIVITIILSPLLRKAV